MSDLQPAPQDPFEQIAKSGGSGEDDPFGAIARAGGVDAGDQSSATGAFARSAARSAAPAAAGLVAFGGGAEVGAAAGAPLAPFTFGLSVPTGALVGGLGSMFLASTAMSKAQDWAIKKLPDSWQESIGADDRQEKLDLSEHPTASFLGGLAPYALTMRPGAIPTKALPANATTFQRLMAHPVTARVFGGGIAGGMELAQEKAQGEAPDWTNVAIATGFGTIFNRPTHIGETLTDIGARPARAAVRRVAPTLAQAADAKVMGPGVTEEVFRGTHEQSPASQMTAQDAARTEQSVTEAPVVPDVHDIARRIDLDLFRDYDDLAKQRDSFRSWIAETGAAEAQPHLSAIEAKMAAMEPQVRAAYRRAAEAAGSPMLEPAPALAPAEQTPQGRIETGFDVRSGAVASKDQPGVTYIDPRVPEFSPTLKDKDGNPANLHKYLAIHEQQEREAMAAGKAYGDAHSHVATPAERAAVEADGVNWEAYTHEMDGYLAKIEHEDIKNPPPDPHIDPNTAVGHHGSPNKANSEAKAPARSLEQQKAYIADDVAKQLMAAGRPPEEARAAGAVIAARYAARSGWIPALGTPEELYNREGAEIHGPGYRMPRTAPAKPGGPRGEPEGTWSLLEFLASRGGISANDPLIADVKGSVGDNKFIPGFGPLIRQSGKGLDAAREAAVEAGYLQDIGETTAGQRTSTIRDLLDAIDNEARGNKVYANGYQPAAEIEEYAQRPRAYEQRPSFEAEAESYDREISFIRKQLETFDENPRFELKEKNGAKRVLASKNIGGTGTPYRITSFDEHGPFGHYEVSDLDKLARELWTYERRGFDPVGHESALEAAHKEQGFPLFQGARGKIRFLEGRPPVITLLKDANASTFIHESGHDFLEQMLRDAAHEAAPDQIRTDAQTVRGWLGAKEDAPITVRQHEKFARGFEQYVREGIAPSPGLAHVFARFKQWLLNIYQTLKGLGQPISDDIRGVFDRMLSTAPERTVIAEERGQDPTLAGIHEADANLAETHEAHGHGDLVAAEADHYVSQPPPEIARELAPAIAQIEEARAAAAGGNEPGPGGGAAGAADLGAEARPGAGGAAEVGPGGGLSGTEPTSSGVGVGRSEELRGGGEALPESAGGQRSADAGRSESAEVVGNQPLAPHPAASFPRRESRLVGKAGNIRAENITSKDELIEAVNEASERLIAQGRTTGPLTMGEMMDAAAEIDIDPTEISEQGLARIFGGVQQLSSKIWALRLAVRQSAEIVSEAMERADRPEATEADLIHLAQVMDRHDMMQSVLSGVTTESGRATGMAFRPLEGWQQAEHLGEFVKQQTGRTLFQLKMIAKLGKRLDTPAKISKWLRDAQKRSFGGMLLEYFVNNLISGIGTHTTYWIANQILKFQEAVPETLIASAIGAARARAGRQGEYVRPGESWEQIKAIGRSLPKSLQGAIEAVRSGQPTLLPGQEARPLLPFQGDTALSIARNITNDPVTWHEVASDFYSAMKGVRDGLVTGAELIRAGGDPQAPVLGFHYSPLGQIPDLAFRGVPVLPIGSAVRLPGRIVAAIHSFDTVANYSRNIAGRAYREGITQGLDGTALAAHIADRTNNPPTDWMEDAHKQAYSATLMAPGGAFVKKFSELVNTAATLPVIGQIRPLKFIDPFVHIGANVINKAIVERSPVGLLSKEIRADLSGANGNIAQDMATARMLAGTALSLVFGGLAMEGYASGSEPADPHQAAMWRLAGNQAHSIRIGDIWYQTGRLGPMGMLMGIAADMYDVAHEISQGELMTAASHLQHAFTQNVLDESFMRGPADLIRAVEDPGRYGEAYLRNFVSSFVPYSVGMAQMARASDPYSRQARTVMDEIRAKVPGLSESLLPRRDIWGEEIPNLPALGAAGVTAIYERQISRDPVNQAMLQLGIYPAQMERKIRNVELTDQQYDDFARIAGRMTKQRLDAIVRSPDYQTWPNHIRHDVIAETIRQSREAARGVLMAKYPDIPAQATAAKRKHLED